MALNLWVESYRPSKIEDYVWVDLEMRATVEQWLADGVLPHTLFSGNPGTGKTSLCKLLLRHLDIPSADVLYINASRERQIDAFQDRIVNFVDSWAMGPSGMKYIILDECLHEDEKIRLVNGTTIALKSMEDFQEYAVWSLNTATGEIEPDVATVISRKLDDVYEVTLEDGRTVRATMDHPFLVRDDYDQIVSCRLCDLKEGDVIVSL